ncbi:metallophosphoesterase 1-like isoform X2 [Tenebrio molitor]|uniref:metallophosphoesterase 1-like isoform X2 n=1 Tax=Tenebrio molitor TaxID=7067 RepID=UPI003624A91D
MRLYRRCVRKPFFCIWFLIVLIYIFYVEFYTYFNNTSSWLEPKCVNQKDCTKILLVADPQIIGQRREIIHSITPFSIIDSDLYLKKTYYWAFRFTQPDIVIFLGDLMDEGSIAPDEEFYGYVRRIFDIFIEKSPSTVKHIWLPGDNDIGGEQFDGVTKQKLKRFHRAFAQPELITYKNITFFKINRLIQSIPVFKDKREFYDTSRIFIGLSHLPLMFMPSLFVEKVFNKMLPQVLFTAHEHKSMIVSTDALLRQDRQIIPVTPDNNKIYEYTLGNTDMYEFIIPTCSYRMGTDKIGYGFAVLVILYFEERFLRFS